MSALAGLWRLDGAPDAAAGCARMLQAQAIYGPGGPAQWAQSDVAIGRRLFSTLPEDRFDPGVVILGDGARLVADVRLDNRGDLEARLGLSRGACAAIADSAILGAAWSRWGEASLDYLVGDFAFAIWDPAKRRLILARDPFGRRPLHYHRARRLVAFASMPVGLHALEEIPLAPDEARLAAFLALRPEVGGGTFFAGVERLEPGGLVVIDSDRTTARRHYRPSARTLALKGPGDYAEALRERLDAAVGAQLRGGGRNVGAHLSSGWDSAAVATTAARQVAENGGRVTAFTATPMSGYRGAAPNGRHGDESLGAAEVAAIYPNIDHVLVRGQGRSPLDDLDGDIALSGRAVLNPCNHVWYNDINRAARTRGVGVMLTGDFGNLGLTDDCLDALPDLWAAGRWREWLGLARAAVAGGELRWRGVVAASLEPRLPTAVARLARMLAGQRGLAPGALSALRPELWRNLGPPTPGERSPDRAVRRLAALTRMDLSLFSKGALARFGVDMRDPLTDRRLVEFCLGVPIGQLTAGGRSRGLARLALADRLPASTLERRTRGYQAADWHVGLSADRERVTRDLAGLAALPAAAGLLDIDRLRTLAARWPDGHWERDEVRDPYRMVLLRGLAVGRFLTRTLGANG